MKINLSTFSLTLDNLGKRQRIWEDTIEFSSIYELLRYCRDTPGLSFEPVLLSASPDCELLSFGVLHFKPSK
ncbi:hypothetical protein [Capybara microvirus Cap3_SP_333]|nr:hypothetical protein [Capybara microvirus Cap3_SP_333]